jgi:hypothetical protein
VLLTTLLSSDRTSLDSHRTLDSNQKEQGNTQMANMANWKSQRKFARKQEWLLYYLSCMEEHTTALCGIAVVRVKVRSFTRAVATCSSICYHAHVFSSPQFPCQSLRDHGSLLVCYLRYRLITNLHLAHCSLTHLSLLQLLSTDYRKLKLPLLWPL